MSNAETADAWEHAAELEKELAQVKADLATERECRVAAEGYIAAIPAMCAGDFSQPCALHVRAPIESLRAQLAAAVAAKEQAERERDEALPLLTEASKAMLSADITLQRQGALIDRLAAENAKLREALGGLCAAIDAIKGDLGSDYPALSEAWVRAKSALAQAPDAEGGEA